jgi:flagellin-like hook-associated protein FlgL
MQQTTIENVDNAFNNIQLTDAALAEINRQLEGMKKIP